MGPGDLAGLIQPLVAAVGVQDRVLVGPETSDDAGVFLLGEHALVATVDFITPVCDDAGRFGRVAAANSLSDVWAMGGEPLFVLNLCCFPTLPEGVAAEILGGAADLVAESGAVVLGGHTVADPELKFGLAVIGRVDRERVLSNDRCQEGDQLVLTKPLGTGLLINGFKAGKLDAAGLEPALVEMERTNQVAARLALANRAHSATDVTGFGLVGHALNLARGSGKGLRLRYASLPVHDAFAGMVAKGVKTGSTEPNRRAAEGLLEDRVGLDRVGRELIFDPQTSGGLLVSLPAAQSAALVAELTARGHRAAEVGEVLAGPPRIEIV